MKIKSLYFQSQLMGRNSIKDTIYSFFFLFCSYPRLLLEVFIRKNFGVRYFSFATAIFIALILAVLPLFFYGYMVALPFVQLSEHFFSVHFATWYVFLILFLVFSNKRRKEIKHKRFEFDFSRYSRYSGDLMPFFLEMWRRKHDAIYKIETRYEPLIFFAGGLLLGALGQYIGWWLMLSAVFYSMGYRASYHQGAEMVYSEADSGIINGQMEKAFVDDLLPSETAGLQIRSPRPNSKDARQKIVDGLIDHDDELEVK